MKQLLAILLLLLSLHSAKAQFDLINSPFDIAALLATPAGGGATCETISESLQAVEGVLSTGDKYFATAITNSSTSVCAVGILMAVHASQTNTYSVSLCSNNSTNRPNGVLGTSAPITSAAIGTTTNWVKFEFASPVTLSAGSTTTNWIRLQKHVDPVDGLATTWARANGNVEIVVRSTDGDNWGNVDLTRQGNFRLYTSP